MRYIMMSLASWRLCCRVGQLRSCSSVVTFNTGSRVVVVGDESGSSALDALYFIDVGLSMWIPHSRDIFK